MNDISISVVIPTYNRRHLLESSLEALQAQDLDRDCFEVIVVDDGGDDGSDHVASRFAREMRVRYFWQDDRGFRAGKARNIGTAIASGRIVVYVDSGVSLAPGCLAAHLRFHDAAKSPSVLVGRVWGFEIPMRWLPRSRHSWTGAMSSPPWRR